MNRVIGIALLVNFGTAHALIDTLPPTIKSSFNVSLSEPSYVDSNNDDAIEHKAESLRLKNLFQLNFQDIAIEEAVDFLKSYPNDLEVRQTLKAFYLTQNNTNLANQQSDYIDLWTTWSNGDSEGAINKALTLLDKYPDNQDFAFALAQFYFAQKKYGLSLVYADPLLKTDPNFIAARALLINLNTATGHYDDAQQLLEQGLAKTATDPVLLEEKTLLSHARTTFIGLESTDFPQFNHLWRLWDSEKRAQAISQAQAYITKNPLQLQISLSLAQFYLYQKNYTAAYQLLLAILERKPDYIAARISLINLFINTNHFDKALDTSNVGLILSPASIPLLTEGKKIAAAQQAANQTPDLALAEYNRLWALWNANQKSQAIDQAIIYLKSNPNDAQVGLSLGQFYYLQKDYSKAISQINIILDNNPTYVAARISLSTVYWEQKQFKIATDLLDQGLLLTPENQALLDAKKKITEIKKFDELWQLWDNHQYDEAIQEAINYLKTNPDNPEIGLSLGQFYFLEKNYPAAYKQIAQILNKNPTYTLARASLIDVLTATNQYHDATTLLEEGLRLAPSDSALLERKNTILSQSVGTTASKIPSIRTSDNPINFSEFNALWALWKANQHEPAIKQAIDYLKLNPDNDEISLSLGQFYLLEEKYPKALAQIKPILEKNPDYVAARSTLIQIYIAQKEFKQARILLDEGIKRSPNDNILKEEIKALQIAENPQTAGANKGLEEFNSLWTLWKTGHQNDAVERANAYLLKNPDEQTVRLSLGQFYLLQKKYRLAREQIVAVLNKEPKYIAARISLIDSYIATQQFEQAQTILDQGFVLTPGDTALLQEKLVLFQAQHPVANNALMVRSSTSSPTKLQYTSSFVEGGQQVAKLTNNNGNWNNQYIRTFIATDANNSWQAEINKDAEFFQRAAYSVIQRNHNFNETVYGNISAGVSDNSIFVPKYYIGGTLFKKFLESKKLVTYLAAQYYVFRPIYTLQVLNPGVIYYFDHPIVVEAGIYLNRTNPGAVDTMVQYIALTEGHEHEHYLTFRAAWGRVGYLPVGNTAEVGYANTVFTETWRQWIGKQWGTNIVTEQYFNPFYKRYSVSVGLFKEFDV